jgi:tetratricopeptide (TPR) repeat protein
MISGTTNGLSSERRLDGWKLIAQHFGRTPRCVQRWHSEYGLPVHRLGGKRSPVFAFVIELDNWIKDRIHPATEEHIATRKLPPLHAPPLSGVSPQPIAVYDLISSAMKARSAEFVALAYKVWGTLSNSNLDLVTGHFRAAIDLDPGNAAAFAGLANALVAEGFLGRVSSSVAYASAETALRRALEIDSGQPQAKCAAAWLKMVSTRDWQGARRGFDEALNDPNRYAGAILGRALLHIAEGCQQAASDLLLEAAGRNQLSVIATAFYSWSEYLAGEYEHALYQIAQVRASGRSGHVVDAVEALASIQFEEPADQIAHIEGLAASSARHDVVRGALGYVYAVNGQSQRAIELLDAVTKPTKRRFGDEPYSVALILIGLKENEKAVHWLERSYRGGSLWSLGFRSDPILYSLRNDPHFRQFMSKVSYPAPETPG